MENLENDLHDLLNPYEVEIYGITGNFNGTVDVPDVPNFIHVRINGGRDVVQARNDLVPSIKDISVILVLSKYVPGELVIDGLQNVYPGSSFPYLTMKKHGESHTWPSYDTVSVYHRQLVPLLVRCSSDRKVNVYGGNYKTPTGFGYYKGIENFNLNAYAPATNGRYALLYLTDAGVLSVRVGATKTLDILSVADIPDLQINETALAGIRLYVGQRKLADQVNPDRTDIIDLRYLNVQRSASSIPTGSFPYLDFDVTGSYDDVQGRLKWDSSLGGLEIGTFLYGTVPIKTIVPPAVISGAYYDIPATRDTVVFISAGTGTLPNSPIYGTSCRVCNEADPSKIVSLYAYGTGTIKGYNSTVLFQHEDLFLTYYGNGRWA